MWSSSAQNFSKIIVFAVDVEHHAGELISHFVDLRRIDGPEAGVAARRVRQVEIGMAYPGVYPQAERDIFKLRGKTFQLRNGIEDHFRGEGLDGLDVFVGEGDAVGVDFLAELLVAQARLIQANWRWSRPCIVSSGEKRTSSKNI